LEDNPFDFVWLDACFSAGCVKPHETTLPTDEWQTHMRVNPQYHWLSAFPIDGCFVGNNGLSYRNVPDSSQNVEVNEGASFYMFRRRFWLRMGMQLDVQEAFNSTGTDDMPQYAKKPHPFSVSTTINRRKTIVHGGYQWVP
jgi:hypothetical protein